jgi:hypothetical protein
VGLLNLCTAGADLAMGLKHMRKHIKTIANISNILINTCNIRPKKIKD